MTELKILFLDIDGVLNSADWMRRRPSKEQFALEHNISPEMFDSNRMTWSLRSIDRDAVARLNRAVKTTGARVVLSSSWRTMWALTKMNWILRQRGFEYDLFGATPCAWDWDKPHPPGFERWQRGHEIAAWLAMLGAPHRIAILDDDADMAHLSDHLVQTSADIGLRDGHVDRVVELLGAA